MKIRGILISMIGLLIPIGAAYLINIKSGIIVAVSITFILATIFLFSKDLYMKFTDIMYGDMVVLGNRAIYIGILYFTSTALYLKGDKIIRTIGNDGKSLYMITGALSGIITVLIASYFISKAKDTTSKAVITLLFGLILGGFLTWFVFYSTLVLGW